MDKPFDSFTGHYFTASWPDHYNNRTLTEILNDLWTNGWRLVCSCENGSGGSYRCSTLIFERMEKQNA